MGVLTAVLALLWIGAAQAASAPVPDAFEITPQAAIGQGSTYSWGLATAVHYAPGSLQLRYANQLALTDFSDPGSAHRHVENWGGGFILAPWPKGTLSFELDSTDDPLLALSSTGVRVGAGYRPFGVAYRLARTRLDGDFVLFRIDEAGDPALLDFAGAITYQHQVELSANPELGPDDQLSVSLRRSFFTPEPRQFAELLDLPILFPLLDLQTSLQNFEMWNLSLGWSRIWSPKVDTMLTVAYTRLALAGTPVWDAGVAAGYQLTRALRGQVAFDHSRSGGFDQSMLSLSATFLWEKPRDELGAFDFGSGD
jgi:hypothetical protein